jgi:hypothetical protein
MARVSEKYYLIGRMESEWGGIDNLLLENFADRSRIEVDLASAEKLAYQQRLIGLSASNLRNIYTRLPVYLDQSTVSESYKNSILILNASINIQSTTDRLIFETLWPDGRIVIATAKEIYEAVQKKWISLVNASAMKYPSGFQRDAEIQGRSFKIMYKKDLLEYGRGDTKITINNSVHSIISGAKESIVYKRKITPDRYSRHKATCTLSDNRGTDGKPLKMIHGITKVDTRLEIPEGVQAVELDSLFHESCNLAGLREIQLPKSLEIMIFKKKQNLRDSTMPIKHRDWGEFHKSILLTFSEGRQYIENIFPEDGGGGLPGDIMPKLKFQIVIPASVVTIDNSFHFEESAAIWAITFANTRNLIAIRNSFCGSSIAYDITVPEGVKSIENSFDIMNFAAFHLPSSIELIRNSIGASTVDSEVADITIPKNSNLVKVDNSFKGPKPKHLGHFFANTPRLKSIIRSSFQFSEVHDSEIPKSVEEIDHSFRYIIIDNTEGGIESTLPNLKTLDYPILYNTIGPGPFLFKIQNITVKSLGLEDGSYPIELVVAGENAEYIGYHLKLVHTVRFKEGIKNIGNKINCTVEKVVIPSTVVSYDPKWQAQLKFFTLELSGGAKYLPSEAFSNCAAQVILPDTLETIGQQNIVGWNNTFLKMPEQLKRLEGPNITHMKSLECVLLPAGLSEIGYGIFEQCSRVVRVYCYKGSAAANIIKEGKCNAERVQLIEIGDVSEIPSADAAGLGVLKNTGMITARASLIASDLLTPSELRNPLWAASLKDIFMVNNTLEEKQEAAKTQGFSIPFKSVFKYKDIDKFSEFMLGGAVLSSSSIPIKEMTRPDNIDPYFVHISDMIHAFGRDQKEEVMEQGLIQKLISAKTYGSTNILYDKNGYSVVKVGISLSPKRERLTNFLTMTRIGDYVTHFTYANIPFNPDVKSDVDAYCMDYGDYYGGVSAIVKVGDKIIDSSREHGRGVLGGMKIPDSLSEKAYKMFDREYMLIYLDTSVGNAKSYGNKIYYSIFDGSVLVCEHAIPGVDNINEYTVVKVTTNGALVVRDLLRANRIKLDTWYKIAIGGDKALEKLAKSKYAYNNPQHSKSAMWCVAKKIKNKIKPFKVEDMDSNLIESVLGTEFFTAGEVSPSTMRGNKKAVTILNKYLLTDGYYLIEAEYDKKGGAKWYNRMSHHYLYFRVPEYTASYFDEIGLDTRIGYWGVDKIESVLEKLESIAKTHETPAELIRETFQQSDQSYYIIMPGRLDSKVVYKGKQYEMDSLVFNVAINKYNGYAYLVKVRGNGKLALLSEITEECIKPLVDGAIRTAYGYTTVIKAPNIPTKGEDLLNIIKLELAGGPKYYSKLIEHRSKGDPNGIVFDEPRATQAYKEMLKFRPE